MLDAQMEVELMVKGFKNPIESGYVGGFKLTTAILYQEDFFVIDEVVDGRQRGLPGLLDEDVVLAGVVAGGARALHVVLDILYLYTLYWSPVTSQKKKKKSKRGIQKVYVL